MTIAVTDAAGFVLAGGHSLRMGRDKALVSIGGHTLITYAVKLLRGAGLTVQIAGGRPALARYAPLIADEVPERGPLEGICCALRQTASELAVFVPVDLPLLPPALIVYMLAHARLTGRAATLPAVNGFTQTFPAVIRRDALPSLEAELAAGNSGPFAAFQAASRNRGEPVTVLAVELLVQAGQIADPRQWPPSRWFINVNSTEELARAAALVA